MCESYLYLNYVVNCQIESNYVSKNSCVHSNRRSMRTQHCWVISLIFFLVLQRLPQQQKSYNAIIENYIYHPPIPQNISIPPTTQSSRRLRELSLLFERNKEKKDKYYRSASENKLLCNKGMILSSN